MHMPSVITSLLSVADYDGIHSCGKVALYDQIKGFAHIFKVPSQLIKREVILEDFS